MNKLFENAIEFLREGKKTVIIFDTDGDGIGAAVILVKSMRRALGKGSKAIPRDHGASLVTRKLIGRIKGKFDLIVFLDTAADEIPEYMTELAEKSKVLILDHHQVHKNLNGQKNIVHVNSSFLGKKIPSHRYCASKLCYDLCSNFTNVEDLDWLAALGIVNDVAKKSWMPFMNGVCKRNNIPLEQLEMANHIITSSYKVSDKNLMISFDACLESLSPYDILNARTENSKKLKVFYDTVQAEIDSVMNDWKNKAEIFEDKKLIILEPQTKFSTTSTISTLISFERPHYTVMIVKRKGKKTSVNIRRQDKKVDCSKLAKKLTEGLKDASGGGHIPAARLEVMTKDWKATKERIMKLF